MVANPHPIIALYPGSFDPPTHGHIDVIRRAARLFAKLIVGVAQNPDKSPLFSRAERVELIRPLVKKLRNVTVQAYDDLTLKFAEREGVRVLVRGIRDVADLSNEVQQANLNLRIGELETVFIMTTDQNVLTSSTYIKQICELGGGDRKMIDRLVPANVARRLEQRFGFGARRARKRAAERESADE